jgi:hypothetical protein
MLATATQAQTASGEELKRIRRGLQALYQFHEGAGDKVHDVSGIGEPLDLSIENPARVKWLPGRLLVQASTRIRSAGPATKIIEAVKASGELTIEVWIKPQHGEQRGPARIVSLSDNPSRRNVTLGQQGHTCDVRLRTTTTNENGLPSTTAPAESLNINLTQIVFVRHADGMARIFIDGQARVKRHVGGQLSNWSDSFAFLLGNEASGDRPWLGEFQLVAIFSQALSDDEVLQNFKIGSQQRIRLASMLPPPAGREVNFVPDVQPILRRRCFECHATANEEGGLNLAIKARVLEGGEHGPAIRRGRSQSSLLIHRVWGLDGHSVMPPEGDRLTAEQVGLLRAWIDQGADWPAGADVLDPRQERAREHWAFRRLASTTLPDVADAEEWIQNDIDRFILRGLKSKQLQPTLPIGSRGLIRRLHFDLIGLPPTPAEVDDFLPASTEDRSGAVEELVDRLLASRHYGERWGRHWLDVARYADSNGQEGDQDRPYAYHYRDFVIRSLNDDMPYDRFVRWQLAGDEYAPDDPQAIAATGFLTAGTHTVLADTFLEEERLRNRYNELDDIVSTLGTGLLGLTVGCARCHDHKYDALSSREYYRLLSVFHSGDRKQVKLPDGEQVLAFRDFGPEPRTTWLFGRADFYDRDRQVKLGFPLVLSTGRDAEEYWTEARQEAANITNSTHQRRALAEWVTDVERGAGPLLARVFVNRIWKHHFGQGLVRTVDDFGVRGETPTHPELLEWLAHDFVKQGWSVKHLHRKIVTSAVYQQGTAYDSRKASADPENHFLWRMQPRRLEAEIIRDVMLSVSGTLNLEPFGPAFKPPISSEANVARNLKGTSYPKDAKDNPQTRRRSVYMFHKRLIPYPLFQAFDRPDLLQSCGKREQTTVASQALALLNDAFVRSRSTDFARRLIKEHGNNDEELVESAFAHAFSRRPTETEKTASREFINSQTAERQLRNEDNSRFQALTDYCQSLFGLNEFVYVD